ncbi:MAG: WecB/TagA/CpsF family glycosyltransferase [Gammaproteobacteria bacterium]
MNSTVREHEIFNQSPQHNQDSVGVGQSYPGNPNTLSIFGLRFNRVTLAEAADLVISAARARRRGFVVTPNVNMLTLLPFEPGLGEICNRAAFQFVDGWPIVWASKRLVREGLPERVAGSDLFPLICQHAEQQGLSLALLGAAEGVADEAARRLRIRYPKLNIVGTYCPPMEAEFSEDSSAKMRTFCNAFRPDLLVLGMGIPKQERWIAANIDKLDIGLALCFGGVIDFAAGKIQRAPSWVVRVGMEWLWRLFMSPRQYWKRTILRFPLFFPLFLKEMFKRKC